MFGRRRSGQSRADELTSDLEGGRSWNVGARNESALVEDAVRLGYEAGAAAGRGEHFTARIAELPGRAALEHVGEQRVSTVRLNADAIRRDLNTQLSGLESQKSMAEQDEKWTQEVHERALSERREYTGSVPRNSISDAILYGVVLAVLAAAEFPTIFTAFDGSPLPTWATPIITFALSVIVAVSAHLVGEYLWEYVSSVKESETVEGRADRVMKLTICVSVVVVMGALMGVMFTIRSSIFHKEENNIFQESLALSTLMLLLQVLFFIIALAMSFIRAKTSSERRAVSHKYRRVKSLERQLERSKQRLDADREKKVALEAQIDTLLRLRSSIDRAEEIELEKERGLLGEVLNRHDTAYELAEHSGPLRV